VAAILGAITAAAIMFLPDDLMNNGLALIILIIAGPVYLFMSDMPKRTPLLWRNIVAVFSFSIYICVFFIFYLYIFYAVQYTLWPWQYGSPALAHLTRSRHPTERRSHFWVSPHMMNLVLMPINLWQAVRTRPRHVSSPVDHTDPTPRLAHRSNGHAHSRQCRRLPAPLPLSRRRDPVDPHRL
jgi:hypothetical protein